MAWEFSGEVVLPADRRTVWTNLNDPDVLKTCIFGLDVLEWTGDTTLRAVAKVKLGPLSVGIRARLDLTDIDVPNRYRILGRGEGGLAGSVEGTADVTLSVVSGGTRLAYELRAEVGGRLARMGSRLIGGLAEGMADRFFLRFAAEIARRSNAPSALDRVDPEP